MKKTFKRTLTALLATATMAVGMGGMSASAAYIGDISLYKAVGAPGSSTQTYQEWRFVITSSTTSMNLTTVTLGNSDAYVYLYSNNGISSIKTTTGAVSVTNAKVGAAALANARLYNFSSGSHYAYGSISG